MIIIYSDKMCGLMKTVWNYWIRGTRLNFSLYRIQVKWMEIFWKQRMRKCSKFQKQGID